jgi:serine/threonine protein kinase
MSILQIGSRIGDYEIVKKLSENPLGASFIGEQKIYNPTTGKPTITKFTIKTLNIKSVEFGIDPNIIQEQIEHLIKVSSNPSSNKYMSNYYAQFIYNDPNGNQYLIIVTEYIVGQTLQDIIITQIDTGVAFDKNILLQMMFEISQAVDYIHSYQIAHQNIKPSNIIFDNINKQLKLIDFTSSCSQHLKCKTIAGTTYYMPPELLENPEKHDFSLVHDIWSMGVVFYQMANLNKDYISFNSNDPEIISKDIRLLPVNPSSFSYVPINSVINTILNKDPNKRPTSGQVVILLRLARPLCIVNNQPYDRQEAMAMVTSFGINVDSNIDDYTLCKILSDYLNTCKINGNEYQKEQLQQLAHVLGIKDDNCAIINNELQTNREKYSDYVTLELLRALERMSWIQLRNMGEHSEKLQNILQNLQVKYTVLYNEVKKLGLLNLKKLEDRRVEVTHKSIIYKKTSSIAYANVYALLANKIIDVILDNNPNAEAGGLPLVQLKFV